MGKNKGGHGKKRSELSSEKLEAERARREKEAEEREVERTRREKEEQQRIRREKEAEEREVERTRREKEAKEMVKKITSENKSKNHKNNWLWKLIFRGDDYHIVGRESDSFKRRKYEEPIQYLEEVTNESIGFTNNIVKSKDGKNIYVPAYINMKVKSIQEIDIKNLIATVGCLIIIDFYVQGLDDDYIDELQKRMVVQVSRSEGLLLGNSQGNNKIEFKKEQQQGKRKFLNYIIRDTFPVQIYDDIFLSPFEILNLVLSVTLKSVSIPEREAVVDENGKEITKALKKVKVSFNCMRNPEEVPISYVAKIKLGVYDLAERLMSVYPTNVATYDQVMDQFQKSISKKRKSPQQQQKSDSSKQVSKSSKKSNIFSPRKDQIISYKQKDQSKKTVKQEKVPKLQYFQYTHFVVPVYKYPGNAWVTIFLPIFMLAALSLTIFFQTGNLEERIGSIATLVLGFIALIPSIKEQIPPSQSITISEAIVYLQALICMLSLVGDFFEIQSKTASIWDNDVFLFCFTMHSLFLGSALILILLHKCIWERRYNKKGKSDCENNPQKYRQQWQNPHCDEYFLKYNKKVQEYNKKHNDKPISFIELKKNQQPQQMIL